MISIGQCVLGSKPRVVAVVDEFLPVTTLLPLKGSADLLEMRIDCFQKPLEQVTDYLNEVRTRVALPMIGTVRENDYTRSNRIDIFKAIIPFVDSIDVELGTDISTKVLSYAEGKTTIISEHDFEMTPDIDGLQSMVYRAVEQGADIVKIATMANNREDVVRLLEFTRTCTVPMVSIVMGPIGTVSRVIAPLFGSLFTYGYLTKPVAPGQLSVSELVSAVSSYFPE